MDNEYISNNETPAIEAEPPKPDIKESEQPKPAGNFSGFDSVTPPEAKPAATTPPPEAKPTTAGGYKNVKVYIKK